MRYFHFYLIPRSDGMTWIELTDMKKGIIFPIISILFKTLSEAATFQSALTTWTSNFIQSSLLWEILNSATTRNFSKIPRKSAIETRLWLAGEMSDGISVGATGTTYKNHFLVSLWGVYSFEYVKFSAALLRWSISAAVHAATFIKAKLMRTNIFCSVIKIKMNVERQRIS